MFIHIGRLEIAIRDRLGVAGETQDRFGSPDRLFSVLSDFPDVSFIVPHFGSGTLPRLLELYKREAMPVEI